jgi:adenylate cyclase, class 2
VQTEIEAKFANVDHSTLRHQLQELGAVCEQPMRLMKRYNYDFPDRRLGNVGGWVRLRDEGGKISLSYKQLNDRTLHGTKEVSLTVDSFETTDVFLRTIGLAPTNYQETKRESWRLGDIEIELDEWPWAKPYVEMEGPDEATLRDVADKLGLDWGKVCHGSVEVIYRDEFDVDDKEFNSIQMFTFEEPIPEWLEKRRLA